MARPSAGMAEPAGAMRLSVLRSPALLVTLLQLADVLVLMLAAPSVRRVDEEMPKIDATVPGA